MKESRTVAPDHQARLEPALAPNSLQTTLLDGLPVGSEAVCAWCEGTLPGARGTFCSRRCRQAAWRFRRRLGAVAERSLNASPLQPGAHFAYADPPYPGLSKRYYGREASFAGEVDHRALLASLTNGQYSGWALSTSARALRELLPLCPPDVRVCAWVKPGGVPRTTFGLHNRWEVLLVVPGRRLRPGVSDWLFAYPARGWGNLVGRKPVAFCAWLFQCLGMVPGDHLEDLFPGTGAVARAWSEVGRWNAPTTSLEERAGRRSGVSA